jgi:hypothetical protein
MALNDIEKHQILKENNGNIWCKTTLQKVVYTIPLIIINQLSQSSCQTLKKYNIYDEMALKCTNSKNGK